MTNINNYKIINNITKYNNFSHQLLLDNSTEMKEYRNISDKMQEKLVDLINAAQTKGNVKVNSNIGVVFYDKLVASQSQSQCDNDNNDDNNYNGSSKCSIKIFAHNLLQLLQIPLKNELIKKTSKTIENVFNKIKLSKRHRKKKGNFTSKDGLNLKTKFEALTRIVSANDFIHFYYSKHVQYDTDNLIQQNFSHFVTKSKIWNLFYLKQLGLN